MIKNSVNKFAVMAQRKSKKTEPDFFPTPPWATRALLENLNKGVLKKCSVLEPACGKGHMAKTLEEYFGIVYASDIIQYGYSMQHDFLDDIAYPREPTFDWVITNPPFKLAEEFILKALQIAKVGVAIFARTQFLEGNKRYRNIYSDHHPSQVMPFVERVPLFKNRLNRKGSTATSYSWFVWDKTMGRWPYTYINWIAPCRKELEKDSDYEL